MNVRRLILSSFAFVALLSLCLTNRPLDNPGFKDTPARTQRADGGGPVPPLPPYSSTGILTADGGGPVPPLPPHSSTGILTADGGGPVPPLPPSTGDVFAFRIAS
jgi:hypothetical protein